MSDKTLIIVESPAKAHKIQDLLGSDFIVAASFGHITELAHGGRHGIGVEIDNNFKPHYVISSDKVEVVDNLLALAKQCKLILIFSDPDREGFGIAFHLRERLKDTNVPIKRGLFNKITKAALIKAINESGEIDMNIVKSQQNRQILDRIVGFSASPFLMSSFNSKSLSAGRVQSVVSRMVIDREIEIEKFKPEDYWVIQTQLSTVNKETFIAKFTGKLSNIKDAEKAKQDLNQSDYVVSEVLSDEEKKPAQPPLITSTLQRIMSKSGMDASVCMQAAQSLYESGLISYLRTDSVRISDEGISELRDFLTKNGHAIPKKPNLYKNKDSAQDAHEALYPIYLDVIPGKNYQIADKNQAAVYKCIYDHFLASQMPPAIYSTLSITAHPQNNAKVKVKATGKALKDEGYLKVLGIIDNSAIDIPNLKVGEIVNLCKGSPKLERKSTQPPPRYSEDKLIKELVSRNIGRPATYADLLSKITARNYVEKKGNVYHATELGKNITNVLVKYFTFMDYDYTAKLEKQLDEIETGKLNYLDMLNKFYPAFKAELDKAYLNEGGTLCEKCGAPMVTRINKNNGQKFLGCSQWSKTKCSGIKQL